MEHFKESNTEKSNVPIEKKERCFNCIIGRAKIYQEEQRKVNTYNVAIAILEKLKRLSNIYQFIFVAPIFFSINVI